MSKLKLSDIQSKEKKRFNKKEYLFAELDEAKVVALLHKAKKKVFIGAKDTGKSFPLSLYKYFTMEKDPMANWLTLQKYSTGSTKRQTAVENKAQINLKQWGYDLPFPYEKKDISFWRKIKDKKNMLNNQSIEYSSFEDADGIQGITPSNGGYYVGIHVEEPAQQDDAITGKTIPREIWEAKLNMMEDSVKRSTSEYNGMRERLLRENGELPREYYHEPLPFSIYITLNDFDENFPESQDAQKYYPRELFLKQSLGFDYLSVLEHYKDKVDGKTPLEPLLAWVNQDMGDGKTRWEIMKENLLKFTVGMVYVERDKYGRLVDTLYIRMHKFAKPSNRTNPKDREDVYEQIYNAMITGNSAELARTLGMVNDNMSQEDKRFNFQGEISGDTEKILKEGKREVLGFSMGWDHDANRGPIGTPITLTATPYFYGNPFQPSKGYKDFKILVHKQARIPGYGKGENGENTKKYHQQMVDISVDKYKQYTDGKNLPWGKHVVFDDDDGSYVPSIVDNFWRCGYNSVYIMPNKNGKMTIDQYGNPDKDGYGRMSRENVMAPRIDEGEIIIDSENKELLKWLKQVPRQISENGIKSSTKGVWGTYMKDASDSMFYGLHPWRWELYYGLNGEE